MKVPPLLKTKFHLNLETLIDVIDEILEEDFDALLDEGSKILHSIEGTILEEEIFFEFDKFIAMAANENYVSESDEEESEFEKITINTDYKIKTSLEEPPTNLELKPLPDNLEYVFLEEPSFLPVIISFQLSAQNKSKLVYVFKKHKEAFSWKTIDIPGICPSFCKYKIQLLDDKKPVIQKQKRLNPNMQEVVKKEIVKLLDSGIIYPIADSPWVSPIHYIPKKGGITVVINENNELVPTRTVTSWRVCIDYRKLNEATAKDHFPLPFMYQMLERFIGNKYFCFLDGFSGYFKIPIDLMDQEKTTFTCPLRTYAYRRMPFGLCNVPATFQRCMLVIFYDMIEESVEVFMYDFSVFRNSFDCHLNNINKMLQRCNDAHLVLNSEICHFMVKEGIVLGHKVSGAGLEVDKAKIDVISKLPPPINIKDVTSFFGHADFYRRFIKDFSKIARPLTKLLEKDTSFEFNDECQKSFDLLKERLTCAPVIVSPNWNLPFELICDASDFAVGAVLKFYIEIKDKKGTKNVAADHLSRIDNNETSDDSEVDDNFPRETLMEINTRDEPWFADFANYLVGDIIPKRMMYQQKNKFFSDLKHYFWEEPVLSKMPKALISDQVILVVRMSRAPLVRDDVVRPGGEVKRCLLIVLYARTIVLHYGVLLRAGMCVRSSCLMCRHAQLAISSDDEDEASTPQPKTQTLKPVKEIPTPKPYKPKIPYPQRLRKEKMEAQYGKFIDMIRAVRINVPLVDVLAGMPNYGKFLKELVSNKHKLEQISSAFLSDESSAMIENKVPPKLGDLGKEDFNALLDEGSSILYSIEGTILEEKLFAEFDELMAMTIEEKSESDSDKEEPTIKKTPLKPIIKTRHLLKNLPFGS
ncbi:reverse transcriptase domain-containing protein [Tanacetum coccineum]